MKFPAIDDYRFADFRVMERLYEGLFKRIEERERRLRVFADVPPCRDRIMDAISSLFTAYPVAEQRPPLFGVPVGIKAVFRMDGAATNAGSLLPDDLFGGREASLVTQLRRAGAIPLALTATTEFAFTEPAATCNPHNENHTPGGSSSGSAAGVAAGFFPLATGSQTIGSVIRPASFCGISGFKPSFGLLPTDGLIHFSRSADHAGLFAATVAELATTLRALCPDRVKKDVPDSFRLAVPVGPYLDQAKSDTVARIRERLAVCAAENGVAIHVVDIPCFEDLSIIAAAHHDLIHAEFAAEHAAHFARYEALYRPRTASAIRYGLSLDQEAISRGRESQRLLREKIHAWMDMHGIDAWVMPSTVGEADKGLLATGDPCMNMPWTHTGLPAVTVPMGRGSLGLPLGMQIAGRLDEDEALLYLAELLHRPAMQ